MTTAELRAEVHRLADLDTDDESLRRAASELHPEKALYRLCDGAIGREFTGCEQVNYNRLEQLRQDEERRR